MEVVVEVAVAVRCVVVAYFAMEDAWFRIVRPFRVLRGYLFAGSPTYSRQPRVPPSILFYGAQKAVVTVEG